ncbi:GspH/FimT family pseudopilin [Pseudomonas sp. F1_0610]|uniref:GspH/FimT family pseudopilin n=1 Tax=Pseudomonas sp. F1_0610 TaxID=3114284 RepID=UPI0039C0342C
MKTKKGFTLVELLVVVILLGVLVAIAVPSFLHSIRANSVKAKADELVALLRYARTESLTKKKNITVVFDKSAWQVKLGDTVERLITMDDLTYSHNLSADHITFINSGRVTSNVDFLICKENDVQSAIYISLEQTGIINTHEAGKNKLGEAITSCQF